MKGIQKAGKLQPIQEPQHRRTSDGYEYVETKWRHESGAVVEVNIDKDPVRYHARVNGGPARSNLDEGGLVGFILSIFGRR